jgi:flagellar protein FliS
MRGIAAYKNNRVQSASPQRIIVMLYQAAVMRLEKGIIALEDGDSEAFLGFSRHVRAILTELRAALDHSVAPELCANLERLYIWCTAELVKVERNTDGDLEENVTVISGVSRVLSELLAGWEEVARSNVEAA